MLVHYKYPRGSTQINGKRIYGYLERHGPVVIPQEVYKERKDSFIQASYTKEILETLFPGREFPDVAFTYHEIRFLEWSQLCALCNAFGFTTNRSNTPRRAKLRKFMRRYC